MKQWKSWIRERVREARIQSGYTQGRLAEVIGVDDLTVSKFERGRVIPSVETVEKIADATGRPLEWFFTPPGAQRTQEFLTIKGERLWRSIRGLSDAIEEAHSVLSDLGQLLPAQMVKEMEAKYRLEGSLRPQSGLWLTHQGVADRTGDAENEEPEPGQTI